MRKLLPIILAFIFSAMSEAAAQVIKPLQYTVIIERTVNRNTNQSYRYVEYQNSAAYQVEHCYNFSTNVCQGCQTNTSYGYLCSVRDTGSWTCGLDYHSLKVFFNGVPTQIGNNVYFNTFARGETRVYRDTINVYQSQFSITRVQSEITEGNPPSYWNYYATPNFNPNSCPSYTASNYVDPQGEYFDQAFSNGTSRYSVNTRIQVVPNMDPTYTLPSHDRILMTASFPSGFNPVWQYQDTVSALSDTWHPVPASLVKNGGTLLEVSGVDLFGAGYFDLLHSTVKFRIKASASSTTSPIVPFTLRLSSPHIVSVTPTHLDCFERNEGKVRIQFDRSLKTGERLNILMYDTTRQISYSALNLSELDSDSSYTWTPELGAGVYHLSLLGKYAKGIEYDSYINTREDTISIYTALNSVNFEDGFNTPDIDDFHAYTDYVGYAQATYTGALTHMKFQQLNQPAKIRFAARVDSSVLCKGSASGVITIAADGGKFYYKYSLKHKDSANWTAWTDFDNNNVGPFNLLNPYIYGPEGVMAKVRNLRAGNYQLRVRDLVDCYAKDSAGNEVTFSFTITEPEKGITIDLLEVTPITSSDSANGNVKIHISGGTPFTVGEIVHLPYDVAWTDSATNQSIAHTNTMLEVNKRMETKAGPLPEGVYYVRIYDAWHSAAAPNNAGCFLELKIPIRKPQPLLVSVEQLKQVTCYDSANAELIAKVTGGIPIDSLRYTFKWYRVTAEGSNLLPVTDSVLRDLGPGNYRVEVKDKYDNTNLSPIFTLTQPSQMQLQMSSTQASCYTTNDGTMSVLVTGGTPYSTGNYVYEWSTGHRTPVVNGVAGGNYLVVVTDSMYCLVIDTISVTSPLRVIPEVVVQPVKCRGACDGQIAVTASGGSGTYTWLWSNGATTSTISNLCAGTYWFRVTDASGCSESDTIVLNEPDTLFVNLGADRKICIGQTIRIDATASDTAVLTYAWTGSNGFTANSAKVNITQPDTYQVSVSNTGGCIVRDTIVVTAENSTINTDFVVSTQAFVNQPVSLVNISQPRTDSVKWILPSLGNVVQVSLQNNDRCELTFSDTGRFAVTMRAYYPSGCIEDSTKIINVIPYGGPITGGNQGNAFLKAYAVIYPNPNNGSFKVDLKFSEMTRARLRLINTLTNIIVDDRTIQGDDEYLLDYNMAPLSNGVYILVIDAAKGSFVYKVIIAQ